jgi:hypothetical protein
LYSNAKLKREPEQGTSAIHRHRTPATASDAWEWCQHIGTLAINEILDFFAVTHEALRLAAADAGFDTNHDLGVAAHRL